MIRKSVLLATLVALCPAAVLAADPAPAAGPRGEGEIFNRFDTNHDGAISKEEAGNAGRIAKSFDTLDANHDGLITQEEMRAAAEARREDMKAQLAARFKAADTNGDSLLTKEEATAGMPAVARRFDRVDTNKDGTVSPEELAAAPMHFGHRGGGWQGKHDDSTQR